MDFLADVILTAVFVWALVVMGIDLVNTDVGLGTKVVLGFAGVVIFIVGLMIVWL